MKTHDEYDAWTQLAAVAETRYGLVTRAELGTWFSRHQVRLRIDQGHLLPIAAGVWRLAGTPLSWRQRVMATHLSVGEPSCVSHATAGRLWELDGIAADDAVDLTVPRRRRPGRSLPRVAVHRSDLSLADDRTLRYGIPVTSPARTLIDLAATREAGALMGIDHLDR